MATNSLEFAASLLDSQTVQTSDQLTHSSTSKKDYRNMLRWQNVTSYSQLETFYSCPRKFQMAKQQAAFGTSLLDRPSNLDFAFGHAVGAGIQNYLITQDLDIAQFNGFLAWNAPFEASIDKKRKNIWGAMIAIQKFAATVVGEQLSDWELLILPNGKPAIEVSFSFHCGNGFKHYGHMDVGLRHKYSKQIAVLDCKTSGFAQAEAALYENSSQALSYAIQLEACLPEEFMDYTVMYLVYSSTEREWALLSFAKSVLEQAEYIKDLLLTHDTIKTYEEVGFYPKRGQACFDYFRRCEYFGECNLVKSERLPVLPDEEEAEQVDYVIDLNQVIERVKERQRGK
jgi:hypothetical protein